ncbi:TolC family protein [Hymenobacter saemangeumensis]|uniref:TolC family protein n=1 Tax=Hymenobacter saemangeumensis TaxID=1084522 RepID=A0ABP8I1H9_9BACT
MLRLLLLTGLLAASTIQLRARPLAQTEQQADTLRLTLPEAEQRFAQRNLTLLAQNYNITVAQAQAVQARLLDNPSLYLEQDVLGRRLLSREVPDGTPGSEVIFSFQQLVSLAGRRRAAGKAAEQAAIVERYNLEDLLRNLRFQLRTTFYDIFYKQQTLRVYESEIPSLRHTVEQYQGQYEKGNIALKEVIRLKAFLFSLESERLALLNELTSHQADLHILLRDSTDTNYQPVANVERVKQLTLNAFPETALTDSALARRADVLARKAGVEQQNLNLRLQRTLAKPDLAVGYTYDRAGSYINNYHALTLGMSVPVFNRNQGNIQAAKAQIAGAQAQLELQQLAVRHEVREAYQLARQADELYRHTNRDLVPFSNLIDAIERSYAKRVIGIVEYLDFYEAYKNNVAQVNALRANRVRAFEQINLAVGKTVFRAE